MTTEVSLIFDGLGFSLATLAIVVAIWYFTDAALQNWGDQSAFGKKPQTKRYATAQVQTEALQQAMVEVL